jgi:hypothetical protein
VIGAGVMLGKAGNAKRQKGEIIQRLRTNVKPAPSVSGREHQQNLEKVRKPGQEV